VERSGFVAGTAGTALQGSAGMRVARGFAIRLRTAGAALRRWVWQLHWRRLPRRKTETWSDRAAFAAERLRGVDGVADMGCGWMTLERYLEPGTLYRPVDLVARDDRTIVCDFDREPPPATGVSAAACLGLLGYLEDPARFMAGLARHYRRAFVTYKAADLPQNARRPAGYRTALTTAQLEAMFAATGWEIEDRHGGVREGQMMWSLLARRPC
jgi:hypothetical protein